MTTMRDDDQDWIDDGAGGCDHDGGTDEALTAFDLSTNRRQALTLNPKP